MSYLRTSLVSATHRSELGRFLRFAIKFHDRSLLHVIRLRKAGLPEEVRAHTSAVLLELRRRRLIGGPHAMQMQSRAVDAVRWVPVPALLALLTVVDREENEVADAEVLVLDFRSNGADGTGAFMAEDGWVGADFDVALLEHEVLRSNVSAMSIAIGPQECNDQISQCGKCQRTSCPPTPHLLASRQGRHLRAQSILWDYGQRMRSSRWLWSVRPS